ncbi:MAG TPA: DUF4330 family protein [Bacillota bacterium]|nr:DUF4330 family protein [Bacillota bacterium]HOK68982.1 DUF4330 family protein [Bacillota bacterium]HPP85377.1 DUF4330 family protein [Bacillota bacterium]
MKVKQKTKSRGILFDIVIALLVIGAVGAAIYFGVRPEEVQTVQIEYTVVFDSVKKEIAGNVMPKETFLSEDGENMGVIISALVDDKVISVFDATAESDYEYSYKKNISDEYKTVRANVSAYATYENGSFYIGGKAIRAGEQIVLRLNDFYGVAHITNVTVKD